MRLLLILLLLVLVIVWFATRGGQRKKRDAEVQKLLAMAAKHGSSLSPPQLMANGYTKEEAEAALMHLRSEGLAEFDVDEHGQPVYRVSKTAVEARSRKGW